MHAGRKQVSTRKIVENDHSEHVFTLSLFKRHSGLPLHPNLMYTTCSTYIEEKWIQIFTYSTYMWTCQKNDSDFFRQTIRTPNPTRTTLQRQGES